jgi:hypothetical protein
MRLLVVRGPAHRARQQKHTARYPRDRSGICADLRERFALALCKTPHLRPNPVQNAATALKYTAYIALI